MCIFSQFVGVWVPGIKWYTFKEEHMQISNKIKFELTTIL